MTLDAREIAAALADHAEDVAVTLLGPPSQTTARELRWGRRGSLSLRRGGERRGLWFDHERGSGGDMLHLIARERGVSLAEAMRIACAEFLGAGVERSVPRPSRAPTVLADDDRARIAAALRLWREAVPLAGTPAEIYLASRGLAYDGAALRWHPACPFGGARHGCMLGLVRNIKTNEPQGIHRTALDAHGRKIGRKALGPIAGGAVKLTDDADVSIVVAIGEGIETTLSIRRLPSLDTMPIWSVLSASGIAAFPALPGIESVWIAADHDASGTGQRAARTAAERLRAAGIETIIIAPNRVGADINDEIADAS